MRNRIFQFEDEEASEDAYIPGSHPQPLSTFFFRKKHLNFIQKYPDGTTVRLSRDDVISVLKAEQAFDAQRNLDQFFYKIRHSHAVDYDGPLPGYRLGLHAANGQDLFCSSAPQPVLAPPSSGNRPPKTACDLAGSPPKKKRTRRDRLACHRRTASPVACDTGVR